MAVDLYPTRLEHLEAPFARRDPVVHARNQMRWEGPLDEVALSKYERDGFLWFKGFFSEDKVTPFFKELADMAKDPEFMRSEQVISDPKSGQIRSVFGMHEISSAFDKLTRDPRILGMVYGNYWAVRFTFTSHVSTTNMDSRAVAFSGIRISKPGMQKTACPECARSAPR